MNRSEAGKIRTEQPWTRTCPTCGMIFTGFAARKCPNGCKKKPDPAVLLSMKLKEALRKYGHHLDWCWLTVQDERCRPEGYAGPPKCTCGFLDIICKS
jgi:hypothetical protein